MDVEFLRWDDPRWGEAHLTYRRVDYWTRLGYLRVLGDEPNPGSGFTRRWPISEYRIACRMAKLIDAGFILAAAAELARHPDRFQSIFEMLTREFEVIHA